MKSSISSIAAWVFVIICSPFLTAGLLWDWLINDTLPLSFCKDPEERKRAGLLMRCAGASIRPAKGDEKIIIRSIDKE